jgi:hypothetical protein
MAARELIDFINAKNSEMTRMAPPTCHMACFVVPAAPYFSMVAIAGEASSAAGAFDIGLLGYCREPL